MPGTKKAGKKAPDADEMEESGPIELGVFEAKAINEGGAEARLSDEGHKSSIVSRFKTVNKGLTVGQKYRVFAELVEGTEGPGETVLANVPADAVKELPEGSEVVVR